MVENRLPGHSSCVDGELVVVMLSSLVVEVLVDIHMHHVLGVVV